MEKHSNNTSWYIIIMRSGCYWHGFGLHVTADSLDISGASGKDELQRSIWPILILSYLAIRMRCIVN